MKLLQRPLLLPCCLQAKEGGLQMELAGSGGASIENRKTIPASCILIKVGKEGMPSFIMRLGF